MEAIEKAFTKIGSRVKFGTIPENARIISTFSGRRRSGRPRPRITVNIEKDGKGEFFKIDTNSSVALNVLNFEKASMHLLLFARDRNDAKYRYLCGRDERGWFAAAVPAGVSTVGAAMDALKPESVLKGQTGLSAKQRNRRKNRAFCRQGEWYFVPAPDLDPDPRLILRNEPVRRGRGNPHTVEEVYRDGGESVYVCRKYPNGLEEPKYRDLLSRKPEAKHWGWNLMRRNMNVYGRGRVTHRDHRTLMLKEWHRIFPNRETEAWFVETVVFLD